MLERLDTPADKVVGFRISGKLTRDDVDAAVRHLDAALRETGGPIRMLVDVAEIRGVEVAALWQDLAYTFRHRRDFERVAVLADRTWLKWWSRTAGALAAAEVRHFGRAELDAAWRWLGE